ncbi:unnamed protein product [Closterium sp. Naga37s-1]|nr:unnamed protein product [Closterium sp. Naga37s-1]
MRGSGVAGRAAIASNITSHARSVSVSDADASGAGHDKTHQWLMSRYLDSAQPSADPFLRRSTFRLDLPLTTAAAPISPASPSPRAAAYSASGSPLPCSADRFHYSPSASYYSASPAPYAHPAAHLHCYSASRSAWAQPAVIPQSQSATAKGDPYAFLHASPFRYSSEIVLDPSKTVQWFGDWDDGRTWKETRSRTHRWKPEDTLAIPGLPGRIPMGKMVEYVWLLLLLAMAVTAAGLVLFSLLFWAPMVTEGPTTAKGTSGTVWLAVMGVLGGRGVVLGSYCFVLWLLLQGKDRGKSASKQHATLLQTSQPPPS